MAPTTDRLRYYIDSGRTGDKIPAFDLSAAPLGTDEEAAGTPVSADRVRQAIDYETGFPNAVLRRDSGIQIWLATMATLVLMTIFIWALLPG
jgi:hypothetical protein